MMMMMMMMMMIIIIKNLVVRWVLTMCKSGFTNQQSSIVHIPEHTCWMVTIQIILQSSSHTDNTTSVQALDL